MKRLCGFLILVLLISGTVQAQQQGELTGALSSLANETVQKLVRIASESRRELVVVPAGILYRESPTPLGETFSAMLTSRIANAGNPNLIAVSRQYEELLEEETGGVEMTTQPLTADILVSGIAFEDAEILLVEIQLVQVSDQRVLGGVETSLPLTENLARAVRPIRMSATGSDDEEPDNSPEEARRLSLGERVTGHTIMPAGDADWFVLDSADFSADSGTDDTQYQLSVWTEGSTDTYMEIYGPSDASSLIMENDDSGNSNARVSALLETGGVYYIKVRGYNDTTTGGYTLTSSLEAAITDSFEPDNNSSSATPFTLNTPPQTHSISPSGDTDWYAVSVDTPDEPYLLIAETTGALDTYMEQYDQFDNLITGDDDSGSDSNARIATVVDQAGTFSFMVRGYDTATQGEYRFQVLRELLQADEFEPDNSPAEAKPLDLQGPPRSHTFVNGQDEDWLILELSGQARFSLETSGDADTYLTLFDAKMNTLVSDDDSGPDYNALIQTTLAPGTYYIKVHSVNDGITNVPYYLHASLF